jgi:nucleoside-diphosphate-sugar epimerase
VFIGLLMPEINKQRILLIGGAGFIGHNLALELSRLGADVFILDSLQVNNILSLVSSKESQNKDFYLHLLSQRLDLLRKSQIPLIVKDARDYNALSNAITEVKPDVIVHLAAIAHANISNKDPYSTFDHSLRTLENALDSARDRVKHFVYFSSSMIYGNFVNGTVTEETPCDPLGIYGALKFAGEKMVIAYNQVFNLPYTIVRPSALYGERCVSRRVGQLFIENAMNGVEVSVNGDGSDRLDFTYIGDLVHGIVRVIESDKSKGEIFNLTYGESRSIADMATLLKQHFKTVDVKFLPKDKLMPSRGTLSVEKAKRLIGYNPQNPLDVGFVRYIEWYKEVQAEFKKNPFSFVSMPG